MELTLTKEQSEIRKTIISFAQRELNADVTERDKAGIFPLNLWNRCAEMRILAAPFPESFGGDGFDFTTTVSIFHALGYACKDSGLVHSLCTQVLCGIMLNLFAWRATQPADMKRAADPVGPDNDRWIAHWCSRVDRVMLGWGEHGAFQERDRQVLAYLDRTKTYCLERNASGQPKHPLYVGKLVKPVLFR